MPRDIPIGNGALLVNFDSHYALRDLYWPYVGQENHTIGHPCRFGVWVEGRFSWVSDSDWQRSLDYGHDTLVTEVRLDRSDVELSLLCSDVVDFQENLYLRKVVVHNRADRERQVRLFFTQDLHIGGHEVGDSAFYEPERRAVVHYKGKRWFLISAAREGPQGRSLGVDGWAVGVKETQGKEGTWRDAEDGALSGNAVAQGSVDSAVAVHVNVSARGKAVAWYFIAIGEDWREVARLNDAVYREGPETFLRRTDNYWFLWASKENEDLGDLPEPVCHLYRRSLLIMRTQIDNHGAIIAANDSDIVRFARDTYSYMWPRDGALVAVALSDAGYSEVTRRFFQFCQRAIGDDAYLLQKYNPDGSLASSWHARYHNGQAVLPIQEDETALALWALWQHFSRFRDVEFVKPLYDRLIKRTANWLLAYRDDDTGLPLPSWDLWEERRGVLAWTVGAVWAGLEAAASFADVFGEPDLALVYREVAGEIRAGAERHLWAPDRNRFVRMIQRREDGSWEADPTVDASLCGLWYFGMLDPADPRIVATMKTIRERLWIKTNVGGVARYEKDGYHQIGQDTESVPGNPWFICTLWLAQWHIAQAQTIADLEPALQILEWVVAHTLPSGVMAEQVNPYTNEPLSVSPLTWSHATLVMTVRGYLARRQAILGGAAKPQS